MEDENMSIIDPEVVEEVVWKIVNESIEKTIDVSYA
jgi:hypothetical protein